MADTVVTLTGDDAQLFKAIQRLVDQQAKLDGAFKKTKDTSKSAGDQAKKSAGEAVKATDDWNAGLSKVVTSLAPMAAGFLTVQGSLQLIGNEISRNVELQKESHDLAMKVAAAQQEAAKNLTGLTTPQISAAMNLKAPEIASAAGFADIAKITDALGAGYSASGNLAKTISAVEESAKLARLTPEQLPTIAAGALDVSKGSGMSDAKANLAFLLSAGKSARIEDPAKLAGTLAPVVGSGVSTVPNQNKEQAAIEIAALFTTLNQQATDKTGDSSRTATTQFLAKLEELFKGRENDPGTVFGRIEAVQKSKELKDALFEKTFGEAAFKKGFELTADPLSDIAAALKAAAAEITFSTKVFDEKVSEMDLASPQLAMAASGAKVDAAVAVQDINDLRSQQNTKIYEMTEKAYKKTSTNMGQFGFGWLEEWSNLTALTAARMGSTESMAWYAKDRLKQRLETLNSLKDTKPTEQLKNEIKTVETTIAQIDAMLVNVQKADALAKKGKPEVEAMIAEEKANQAKPKTVVIDQTLPQPLPDTKKAAEESKLEELRQQTETMLWAVKNLQYSFEDMTRSSRKVGTELERGARAAKTSAQKQAALRANAGGE